MTFAPGKHYSFDDSLSSANNLRRLGIFDLRRMDMTVPPRTIRRSRFRHGSSSDPRINTNSPLNYS